MRTKAETMQGLITKYLPKDPDEAKAFMYELDILLMRYESAIREVRTKLEILNDELSLLGHQNPINSILSRRKKTLSIFEKLERQGDELTLSSIQENLNDVAGIRVICGFIDDIYKVAKMLARQDDVRLIQVKDYIKNPKPNGYRSYHLIVKVPIFLSDKVENVAVEVQFRTIAMDFWASLEHKLRYKKNLSEEKEKEIERRLLLCAEISAKLDNQMQKVKEIIEDDSQFL